MEFILLSPVKLSKPKKDGSFQGAFEVRIPHIHTFIEHGVEIKKPIEILYQSTPKGQYQAEIANVQSVSAEVAEMYLKFQSIIAHCITNAEAINNQLRDLLLSIDTLQAKKEEIIRMDFMGLRGVFSNFLHGFAAIKREPNFDIKVKRDNLTKTMYRFILDRNVYTHGTLLLQRPEEIFVIAYIEEKKTKESCKVTLEILQSFLNASTFIASRLAEVRKFYSNSVRVK
jgi:hypothetical protein